MSANHQCGYSVTPIYEGGEMVAWQCNYCGKVIPMQPTRAELLAALEAIIEQYENRSRIRLEAAIEGARTLLK